MHIYKWLLRLSSLIHVAAFVLYTVMMANIAIVISVAVICCSILSSHVSTAGNCYPGERRVVQKATVVSHFFYI